MGPRSHTGAMKNYKLEMFDDTLQLFLFVNVTNGDEILHKLKTITVEAAFIDAKLIVDEFQVLTAAQKALTCRDTTKLTTNNLHSELVYRLSPSKSITDSFAKFGVSATTTTLLVGVFSGSDAIWGEVKRTVHGVEEDISKLREHCDEALVRKTYKICAPELTMGGDPLLNAVITRIGTRDSL
eukprot:JP437463.1.p1 GENE.JP437463.1~~JP437463.1.p1  ORF type:complete len:183 (+),score=9.75 JP437463.1:1-549(+)